MNQQVVDLEVEALEANPLVRQKPHMLKKYRSQAHMCYRQTHDGKVYVCPDKAVTKGHDNEPLPENERVMAI